MSLSPSKTNVVCPECKKTTSRKALWEHKLRMHTDPKLWKHKCPSCPRTFPIPRALKEHMWHHSEKKPFKCEVCDKSFGCLRAHMNAHKPKPKPPSPPLPKTNFECSECKKTNLSKASLWEHKMRMHTDPKLWKHKCSSCSQTFPVRRALKEHMWHHIGEKPFKCKICDKRFVIERYLVAHLNLHMIPNWDCDLCEKKFHTKAALKSHKKNLHFSNSKWFCKICRLSFDTAFAHSEHIAGHRRENVCKICFKDFLYKQSLLRHLESHKNIKKESEVNEEEVIREIQKEGISEVQEEEVISEVKIEEVISEVKIEEGISEVKKEEVISEVKKEEMGFSGLLTLKNHVDSINEKIRYPL